MAPSKQPAQSPCLRNDPFDHAIERAIDWMAYTVDDMLVSVPRETLPSPTSRARKLMTSVSSPAIVCSTLLAAAPIAPAAIAAIESMNDATTCAIWLQPLDEEHDRVVDRDDRLDERAGRVEAAEELGDRRLDDLGLDEGHDLRP